MAKGRRARGDETTLAASGDDVSSADFLLVAGAGKISAHQLSDPEISIGRDGRCTIVLDDRTLSRRHAVVRRGPPVTVQDLGSKNGVHVAGRVLHGGEPVPLSSGLGFHIGPFSFVLVSGGARSSTTSNPSGVELSLVRDPTPNGVPELVREAAKTELSVLILGETGVGKEILAQTIHTLSGRSGPLCRINCAALSETLLESELFGHEKGAFTGAAAAKAGLLEASEGGTVFLDEVGELPLSIQAKLLRAVEAREVLRIGSTRPVKVDVRFVAATNRDLAREVGAGRFRHDLYFRLDGVTLKIPPLRERSEMIVPLALEFLREVAARAGKVPPGITPKALAALTAYEWPGNVRELRAVIERTALLAKGKEISAELLAFSKVSRVEAEPREAPVAAPASPSPASDDELLERERILKALEDCAGNQTRAAKALGISRTTLTQKIRFHRIPRPRGRT